MLRHCLGPALVVLLGLGACSDAAPPPTFSDIRFVATPQIRLAVSTIDLVAEFVPTFRAPQVEQNFPVPPQRAIENWVHDRLKADRPDSAFRARVTILDASAREAEGGARYDARCAVKIEILDAHGFAVRTARAEATRRKEIDADASADEKDMVWYGMTRDLVGSLGGELERQIRSSFYPYVL
jgi:hypothetical protein